MDEEGEDGSAAVPQVVEEEEEKSPEDDKKMKPRRLLLSGVPPPEVAAPKYLKAKFRMGSIKGQLNYERKEQTFSTDDLRDDVKERIVQLRAWKRERDSFRADHKERWDISVAQPIRKDKRTRQNSEHDRGSAYAFNFRAEVLPPKNLPFVPKPSKWSVSRVPPKTADAVLAARAARPLLLQPPSVSGAMKRTQEMPIHPNLDDGRPIWRPDSRVMTRPDQIALARKGTAAAKRASQRAQRLLCTPDRHATLVERHDSFQKQVRVLKRSGSRIAAYSAAYSQPLEIPKHNRQAVEPSRRTRHFAHSGVYEYNHTEQTWMWSDTGSYERASPGDVVTIRDAGAYNLASPNNA